MTTTTTTTVLTAGQRHALLRTLRLWARDPAATAERIEALLRDGRDVATTLAARGWDDSLIWEVTEIIAGPEYCSPPR